MQLKFLIFKKIKNAPGRITNKNYRKQITHKRTEEKRSLQKYIIWGKICFLSIGYRRIHWKNNYKSNRKSRNLKTS